MIKKTTKIETPEYYINYAFSKATKAALTEKSKNRTKGIIKLKKIEQIRIKEVEAVLKVQIDKIIKTFPHNKNQSEVYIEIIKSLASIEDLEKALTSLDWLKQKLKKLTQEYVKKINNAISVRTVRNHKTTYYGRVSSILKKLRKNLEALEKTRRKILYMPEIQEKLYTIVIAGSPNVGKSTLLRNITKSKPETAEYAFTTKTLKVGHIKKRNEMLQVIDTPGLLDRPLTKRNKIEMQAITALKHLANQILYIIDPTDNSGYSLEEQIHTYKTIKKEFNKTPITPIINKIDIAEEIRVKQIKKIIKNCLEISSLEKIGLDKVNALL